MQRGVVFPLRIQQISEGVKQLSELAPLKACSFPFNVCYSIFQEQCFLPFQATWVSPLVHYRTILMFLTEQLVYGNRWQTIVYVWILELFLSTSRVIVVGRLYIYSFSIFIYLTFFALSNDPSFENMLIYTKACVKCWVVAVKHFHLLQFKLGYIVWSSVITGHWDLFENKISRNHG